MNYKSNFKCTIFGHKWGKEYNVKPDMSKIDPKNIVKIHELIFESLYTYRMCVKCYKKQCKLLTTWQTTDSYTKDDLREFTLRKILD